MKTNRELLQKYDEYPSDQNKVYFSYDACLKVMSDARIDTLLHLKDQMTVNAKKLTGESCVKLVEQLIEEIKR